MEDIQPSTNKTATTGPPGLTFSGLVKLSKLRLSFLVVLSAGIAYVLGARGDASAGFVMLFSLAGLLVTISANIVNQILERHPDALMLRTQTRPLATGQISVGLGWVLAIGFLFLGLGIYAGFFNLLSVVLSLLSWFLYGFVYTPMKLKTPAAVAVGAIPGAMPVLIGYAGAAGRIDTEIILWFVIQFVWQFPHFWSIAWVLHDDYMRGGFRLLPGPTKERDSVAALLMAVYTFLLIPVAITPYVFGFDDATYGIISLVAGIVFFIISLGVVRYQTDAAARRLMFASFIYLPLIQFSLLFCSPWW